MSDESPREPVDDEYVAASETVEFDAVEADPALKRVEFELMLGGDKLGDDLNLRPDFQRPIEIRFGRTLETSPCFLVQGPECPQLGADYILIQPDVVAKDPRKGWVPIGGVHAEHPEERAVRTVYIGRNETPQLRLGADVSRTHAYIDFGHTGGSEVLSLGAYYDPKGHYARVLAHPDDLKEIPRFAHRVH